jgi:hypothetical protein
MKNLLYTTVVALLIAGCSSSDGALEAPTDISNVSTLTRVGGALVQWNIPTDSSFTYLEIKYLKNGKQVVEKASKYTDTLLVEGLINKEEFSFEIQAVNETIGKKTLGNSFITNVVRPIRRSPDITYYPEELNKLSVTNNMIDTFTQENSEGPKTNLVDGDPNTFWHSAWSSGVAPLPHWVEVNFDAQTELGAIKYWFRNHGDTRGRPTQWGLETSEDGVTWDRVWESKENLPISDRTVEHTLPFDKNYTAKHFRVLILKNGSGTYAHLGEISFHNMNSRIVDKELEAEEIYYNF